jgi:poly(beta-D-mannuronate) C5 epimerase
MIICFEGQSTGSKIFPVIILSLISLIAVLSSSIFVNNIHASSIYIAREQGIVSEETSKVGHNPGDTSKVKHIKFLDVSSSQAGRVTVHTMALDPQFCVKYDSTNREITITCESTNLSQVHDVLNDPDVLEKEDDGVWLLNANLTINEGANFTIDSNDTKWLKIDSTTNESAYQIRVIGSMKVDSVKISSWNTTSDNYTTTDGKIARASIAIVPKGEGKADFTNSELSYLGYQASGRQGLAYNKADGGSIRNNTIHHLWHGLDSRGLSNMIIADNDIYANAKYGLYPRTGSHDLIIRNNRVHNNDGLGIVCSLDCKNIVIEANEIFGNKIGGVMLSRNVVDSVVANNTVYDEVKGIVISESHNDKIYDNVISNSDVGIETKSNSSMNRIYDNSVLNPAKYGIQIITGAKENTISKNLIANPVKYGICVYNKGIKNLLVENYITNSSKHGICISDGASDNLIKANSINGAKGYGIQITDANVKNNTLYGNMINMTDTGISINNNTDSTLVQNNVSLADDFAYSITGNSLLKLINTTFNSDKIRSSGGENNTLLIADSGTIIINNVAGNDKSIDTSENIYAVRLQDPDTINVTTSR